jgi:hypothetical protein
MSAKDLYYCSVAVRLESTIMFSNFITFAIAESPDEAIETARLYTEKALPGWNIGDAVVTPIDRSLLERAAVEVLGWRKSETVH